MEGACRIYLKQAFSISRRHFQSARIKRYKVVFKTNFQSETGLFSQVSHEFGKKMKRREQRNSLRMTPYLSLSRTIGVESLKGKAAHFGGLNWMVPQPLRPNFPHSHPRKRKKTTGIHPSSGGWNRRRKRIHLPIEIPLLLLLLFIIIIHVVVEVENLTSGGGSAGSRRAWQRRRRKAARAAAVRQAAASLADRLLSFVTSVITHKWTSRTRMRYPFLYPPPV